MRCRLLGFALLFGALVAGGCGGGGGGAGGAAVQEQESSFTTNADGTTSRTTIGVPGGSATVPEGTTLTDSNGDPVTGKVTATVTVGSKDAEVPVPEPLPNEQFLTFLNIVLTGSDGKTVSRLSQDMTVKVAVSGVIPADLLVHYRFNGYSWLPEETVVVGPDNSVELKVNRTACHALLKRKVNDGTAPSVVLVSPSDGASNVPGNTKIIAVFDEPMDASSINASTFTVGVVASDLTFGVVANKILTGSEIAGTVTYDRDSRTAVFSPNYLLPLNTMLVAVISAEVKDVSGNKMGEAMTWTFSKQTSLDSQRPTVTDAAPADDQVWQSDTRIRVSFSELMDPLSIKDTLIQSDPPLHGKVIYDPIANAAFFRPSSSLTPGVTYRFTVSECATDLAGNPLVSYSWSFTPHPATGSSGGTGMK